MTAEIHICTVLLPAVPNSDAGRQSLLLTYLGRAHQLMAHLLPEHPSSRGVSNIQSSGVEMSSPRVVASLLAIGAAGVVIASCGEQTSPTVASSVASSTAVHAGATEFFDMLADPGGPLGTFADPVVYPPGAGPE